LTWTASSGATSYNIYRGGAANGESTTAIATGVTTASYTDTAVTNGTPYYYKVAAVNAGGTSALSNEASATPQVGAPSAPTGLTASSGNAQVKLTWTASSGATSYNVYRGTAANGESTTAIATGVTTASYTDTTVTNGTPYYYKVAAVNAGGTSALSNEASATPLAPVPVTIAVSAGSGQSALVNTAFATALQAVVKDSGGNPVPSVTVVFSAPTSGASGLFGANTTATVTTSASGIATAPAFTANGVAGQYSVTASTTGVSTNASFPLTNTTQSSTTQPANASAVYSAASQTVTLTAVVNSATSGSVTFAVGTLGIVTAQVASAHAQASFQIPAGTKAGSYTITATYSGGGSLGGSSGTATMTIAKADSVITWSNPPDIQLGSALGADELNATANVPGIFVYTPPAGTVLLVGNNQPLRVDFTPTDAADYNTASKTVTINVTNPFGGAPHIVTTHMLTRDPSTGEVVVNMTFTNVGGTAAANVQLTVLRVGTTMATPLPAAVGSIAAGGEATVTVRLAASVGDSGEREMISIAGTYTGGIFESQGRVVLP
jgi:hypothetical protein